MLEGRYFKTLESVFIFIVAVINPSTEHKETTAMTTAHTQHSDVVANVTIDIGCREWTTGNGASNIQLGWKER